MYIMYAIRRSNCVLYKLIHGAVRRIGPVCCRAQRNYLSESGFTGISHQNIHMCGVKDFKGIHSQTHFGTGGDTDTEIYSDGRKSLLQQQHVQGSVAFNLDVMVSLLRQENAEDVCVIKVPAELKYTEFFIVVSGSSTRHLKAMALYALKVYKFMKKECDPHVHIEGKDAEDWMCIDFGSMVVHFMLPETRATYELEKLWTLRSYDEQFSSIPTQILPADFIYDAETK